MISVRYIVVGKVRLQKPKDRRLQTFTTDYFTPPHTSMNNFIIHSGEAGLFPCFLAIMHNNLLPYYVVITLMHALRNRDSYT